MTVQRLRDTVLARSVASRIPGALTRGPTHDLEGRPLLYLTVDDGPDLEGTPLWLECLARHRARATFFVSRAPAQAHPDLLRDVLEAGHRLGNHGGAHVSAWRTRPSLVLEGFDATERILDGLGARAVRDVRPPYGRVTPGLVRWTRRGRRRLVLWDAMPGDYLEGRSASRLAREILATSRPGSVVVLHDGAPAHRATGALEVALGQLAAAGWRFPHLPSPT